MSSSVKEAIEDFIKPPTLKPFDSEDYIIEGIIGEHDIFEPVLVIADKEYKCKYELCPIIKDGEILEPTFPLKKTRRDLSSLCSWVKGALYAFRVHVSVSNWDPLLPLRSHEMDSVSVAPLIRKLSLTDVAPVSFFRLAADGLFPNLTDLEYQPFKNLTNIVTAGYRGFKNFGTVVTPELIDLMKESDIVSKLHVLDCRSYQVDSIARIAIGELMCRYESLINLDKIIDLTYVGRLFIVDETPTDKDSLDKLVPLLRKVPRVCMYYLLYLKISEHYDYRPSEVYFYSGEITPEIAPKVELFDKVLCYAHTLCYVEATHYSVDRNENDMIYLHTVKGLREASYRIKNKSTGYNYEVKIRLKREPQLTKSVNKI